ncbi:diphosphomevalonate decarboxylase [Agrilus planipennis]|uniref:Diphosphomevalonate decarboxylase n=1 Tax=Agrilus planipennis TaxID=224129 RepID=A0A1W4XSS6_AGRPL|nr:diphosphomevalonate decarboxylase [Agrilus planipennis]
MRIVTAVAPVNIATIKYWGKRDDDLILPLNDSFSATLSLEDMCAKTTVMISPYLLENKFWLNGKEENMDNPRLSNCLKALKDRLNKENSEEVSSWKIHICSENNFPTAAGLASSAAGYACLVYALASLYQVDGDITAIARNGSGSACRSIFGGWVRWHKGSLEDGTDSIATQIFPTDHWPEIRVLVLVVNDSRKKYSSTLGMKQTVMTSELLKHRTKFVVPDRIEKIIDAVHKKDFQSFAKLTMKDSNQFHAVCCDTYPPCFYMNDVSHAIIDMVHVYNEFKGQLKIAYTFDAGPNACLFIQESDLSEVLSLIRYVFPSNLNANEYYRGIALDKDLFSKDLSLPTGITQYGLNTLRYIIHTKIGDGPRLLQDAKEHLLDSNGLPKNC